MRQHQLDLDLNTEKVGRPYTLVCRKNDQSRIRALNQRKEDEKVLKQLRMLFSGSKEK